MQAIETKFLGPTDTKGDRIKATCAAGSMTIGFYSDRLGNDDNETKHANAARLLAEKLGWTGNAYGELVTGCLPNGNYCHVFTKRKG